MRTRTRLAGSALLPLLSFTTAAIAQDSPPLIRGELAGQILATGARRVLIMDSAGKILWEHKGGNCSDVWMLDNGNILHADGNTTEIDPKTNEVVFSYKPTVTKGGGTFTCQRLDNGNTVVGENSTGRILELAKDGEVVFEMKVEPYTEGNHHNLRMVRKLKNGNYLVCHSGKGLVREYAPDGRSVFEVTVKGVAYSAVRLPNGNTLVGHIDFISEFDPEGKQVWQFAKSDLGDLVTGMMCGIHPQPNGNIAVGVYRAYNKEKQGVALFEINRDKKVVWQYSNPGADRAMMSIQKLTADGKPLPGDVLR